MTTITISGGFHRAGELQMLAPDDGGFSAGQYLRIHKHACGIPGCACGLRDVFVEGISKQEFREMMFEGRTAHEMRHLSAGR